MDELAERGVEGGVCATYKKYVASRRGVGGGGSTIEDDS